MEPYWHVINEAGGRVLVTENDVPACVAETDGHALTLEPDAEIAAMLAETEAAAV